MHISGRDAHDFFQRRDSIGRFLQRILVHRDHGFLRGRFDFGARTLLQNQFPQLGRDRQQFENSDPAAISRAAAFLASAAVKKCARSILASSQ